ncbi:MAG TPA: TDP-N-acetylfucosamine:lipid II N-acetylfucosaminyltransferase, partial [Clostridia bacterium]|nr:TDP-N-acetylfucosamine:lipid II N-acetylfucosaminyltransferase [Clostridia bacterium]
VKKPADIHEELRILLGNSASETNNHFEALDVLAGFAAENIRVICPLSYGDNDYRDRVIKYGQSVLGEKFTYLDKFYNISEYMDILFTVDIGIFNNDRQQALGNIYPLLYLGKKIYMKNDTTMWDEIRNEFGLGVFEIGKIPSESFEQFKYIPEEVVSHNNKIMEGLYSGDFAKTAWSIIFGG